MTSISQLQIFVQEYAETIANVLEVDVTIVDEDCIRIGGTGCLNETVGLPVPHGSFFQDILKTGKSGIIFHDLKKNSACQGCLYANKCKELATMGFPIFKRNKPIGVIGLIAFNQEQKEKIVNTSPRLLKFLDHMSSLLESKLLLIEANERLQSQVKETMNAVKKDFSFDNIKGADEKFTSVLQKAKQIAASNSTVLIRGESGTGKELLAKAIHSESNRSHCPFIAINCSSIPENLLESELFGYEGGAFTGAKKGGKMGKFELAHTGTIFLDEIGEMPFPLQAKLLRVLQEKTIDRLGGEKPIPVDVRVIAATHADLEDMIKKGTFREDLYYRLNVIPLMLPPLRERKEDIPLYLKHFLKKYCRMLNKEPLTIDPSLAHWFKNYDWPGNIRQLENIAEYMVNMTTGEVLKCKDLPDYLLKKHPPIDTDGAFCLQEKLCEYEKEILKKYVQPSATTEDKKMAADKLKISLATLYRKLEKYNIG